MAAFGAPGAGLPEQAARLRVGVLPDEAEPRLREVYDPLLSYLTSATGLGFELDVPEDYDALVDAFDAGALDLAWFGGLTFARARLRSNADPLVSRDIDSRFTTVFIVAGDAEGDSLEAFAGKPMAFGPLLSTSGHLMPRAFLSKREIQPESFFAKVRHSSGHDETVAWVRDGAVAIGAVNSQIFYALARAGRVGGDGPRIVATTAPYQNYVWATSPTLDPGVRRSLLAAFLALDPADPEQAAMLANLGGGGFVPVDAESFVELQRVAREIGLLEGAR